MDKPAARRRPEPHRLDPPPPGLRTATLAGAAAIALWAFLALLTRGAPTVPPFALTALCFAVPALGGLALLATQGRLRELRQPPLAWLHGVGGLFGFHALYFAALGLAPAAQANLLNYTWPLMLVLLSAALPLPNGLRHGLRPGHIAGVALGAAGCALLLAGTAQFRTADLPGYALALLSAAVWASYSALARRFAAVPTGALAGFCAATALLAALCHALWEPPLWRSPAQLDATAWLCILLMGAGPLGSAFFLWDRGMKRGDPRLLGTLAYATPVLSTLLLIAGGIAPLTLATLAAAALVATAGLIAARA